MSTSARSQVCLLDDDPAIHSLVSKALESSGFTVSAATLWSEVSHMLVTMQDVILVCDLNMPGIRGEDFCRSVVRHNPSVKLLIFSGVEEKELQAASSRLGGVATVPKRKGVGELLRTLKELDRTASARITCAITRSCPEPILLGPTPTVIGRSPKSQIVINSEEVSRSHASLTMKGGEVEVADLGSRNGTFVDGKRINGSVRVDTTTTVVVGNVEVELHVRVALATAKERVATVYSSETAAFRKPGREQPSHETQVRPAVRPSSSP